MMGDNGERMFPDFERYIIDGLPSNLKAALPFGWLLDDGTFIITRDIWSGQAD
jgi:hypothetical protein